MANFTYPKGTDTRVVKVTLSETDYLLACRLGKGYAAHGLREAIKLAYYQRLTKESTCP